MRGEAKDLVFQEERRREQAAAGTRQEAGANGRRDHLTLDIIRHL